MGARLQKRPGKCFLDRQSDALSSEVYNGDEFVARDPRSLDRNALVLLC
jgi:fructoselysine 6-phosphate deglycase